MYQRIWRLSTKLMELPRNGPLKSHEHVNSNHTIFGARYYRFLRHRTVVFHPAKPPLIPHCRSLREQIRATPKGSVVEVPRIRSWNRAPRSSGIPRRRQQIRPLLRWRTSTIGSSRDIVLREYPEEVTPKFSSVQDTLKSPGDKIVRIQDEIYEMKTRTLQRDFALRRAHFIRIRCRENVLIIIAINLATLIFRLSCQFPSSRADPSSDRLIFQHAFPFLSQSLPFLPFLPSPLSFSLLLLLFFYEYKRVRALVSSTIISIMRLMVKCKSFNKCNIVRPSQKSVRNRECTDLLRGSRLFRDVAGYPWSCRRESPRVLRACLCDRRDAWEIRSNCIKKYAEHISL